MRVPFILMMLMVWVRGSTFYGVWGETGRRITYYAGLSEIYLDFTSMRLTTRILSALHIHRFRIHRFNQPQIQLVESDSTGLTPWI